MELRLKNSTGCHQQRSTHQAQCRARWPAVASASTARFPAGALPPWCGASVSSLTCCISCADRQEGQESHQQEGRVELHRHGLTCTVELSEIVFWRRKTDGWFQEVDM